MTTFDTQTSVWPVVTNHFIAAKRFWKSLVIVGIGTPLLYVLSLGVGLGVVINRHSNTLGVPYLQYVAPAFLAASALQIAAGAAAYPITSGFKWQRTFHGMAATPLSARQICDGQLLWIVLRLLGGSTIYLAIMAAFGGARTPWVVLAVPIATLTGISFGAVVAAIAAWVDREENLFNGLFRFVVTPMFLFSGTFYPISQLPRWGQVLAWISPLWHGTELARDAGLGGGLPALAVLGHIAYLLVWLVVGVILARQRFAVRLAK
jgi:lipooligosaccharide transport system permease protein